MRQRKIFFLMVGLAGLTIAAGAVVAAASSFAGDPDEQATATSTPSAAVIYDPALAALPEPTPEPSTSAAVDESAPTPPVINPLRPSESTPEPPTPVAAEETGPTPPPTSTLIPPYPWLVTPHPTSKPPPPDYTPAPAAPDVEDIHLNEDGLYQVAGPDGCVWTETRRGRVPSRSGELVEEVSLLTPCTDEFWLVYYPATGELSAATY